MLATSLCCMVCLLQGLHVAAPLQVLTAPGRGILHTQEFVSRLRWVTSVGPAPMADVLRVHDWNYIRRLQVGSWEGSGCGGC
jgi:hypothetical protein